MTLPGVEKGPVEGLYYVPIIYPIIVALMIIGGAVLIMYLSYRFPYERPPIPIESKEVTDADS